MLSGDGMSLSISYDDTFILTSLVETFILIMSLKLLESSLQWTPDRKKCNRFITNCHSTCTPVLCNGQLGFGATKKIPVGIEFFSYVKNFLFFQENCIASYHVCENDLYGQRTLFCVPSDNCHDHISSTPLYGHWLPTHCLFSSSQSCANCRYCTQQKCLKGLTSVSLLLVDPCSKTPNQVFWILVHKVLLPCLYTEVSIFGHIVLRLWLFLDLSLILSVNFFLKSRLIRTPG